MSATISTIRTAEFVSPKHPDKLCDQISDAILDACLEADPDSRVAIEAAGGHGKLFLTGEITTHAVPDYEQIVTDIAGDIELVTAISQQSPEIANGVDDGGAGDQGVMIGYATSETPQLLPLEYVLAQQLNQVLYKRWPYDGKTQITLDSKAEVTAVVASFQHAPHGELTAAVHDWLDQEPLGIAADSLRVHTNPAGDWDIGGFEADAGLTGRKLVVDNYGPQIPIGGGCFSGKDPSKVDRSAAYMARKVAVDYLKREQADEVLVRLAYAIGYDQPVEATVTLDGRQQEITGYDLSPNGIVKFLELKRPIYRQTARSGHFTNPDFPWNQPAKPA